MGPPSRPLLKEQDACPGAYARAPAALEASQALAWFEKGALHLLYADGIPSKIIQAVDLSRNVRAEWEAEGHERRAQKLAAERERRRRG